MKKLPSVTIAVCALNEEENITRFLRSVLDQKADTYTLDKIVVYSDGSTDNTVKNVKSLMKKHKHIELIAYKDRIGKSSRLNHLYASLTSDILVQSDADVVFSHPHVVDDIIAPLTKPDNVYMSGGRPMPVAGTTFTEKAINCTFEAYDPLRGTLRGGNNVFSVDGRLLAYKKALVKQITIPADMTANDAFTYYSCLTLGYEYRYVAKAIVWFRSPQTVRDQIKQNTRFVFAPAKMSTCFDPALVAREYYVPRSLMLRLQVTQFVKHPVLCLYIFAINVYCKLKAKKAIDYYTAMWPMAESTKHIHEA